MNKTEQKKKIKELIYLARITRDSISTKNIEIIDLVKQAESLNKNLSERDYTEIFDLDGFTRNLYFYFFEWELSDIHNLTDEFNSEITELINTLSETKAIQLEERYSHINEILNKFDQTSMTYETVDNALEHIDEAIEMLVEIFNSI